MIEVDCGHQDLISKEPYVLGGTVEPIGNRGELTFTVELDRLSLAISHRGSSVSVLRSTTMQTGGRVELEPQATQ